MDYEALFRESLDQLREEGRYRVFAELERQAGAFPRAARYHGAAAARSPSGARTTISAWASTRRCSPRCTRRSTRCGAGAGGTRNISGTNHAPCPARARACRSPRQGSGAALHLGLCLELGGARHARGPAPRLRRPLRCRQPRLDDRGHPPQPRRAPDFRAQRPGGSRPPARRDRSGTAEARRLRIASIRWTATSPRSPRFCDVCRSARRDDLPRRGPCRRALRPARRRHRRARRADGPAHGDRGHARQGVRRDGRLYRGLGGAVRFRAQLRLGLHLHHRAAAGARRRRARPASGISRTARPSARRTSDRVATVRAKLEGDGHPACSTIPATSCR